MSNAAFDTLTVARKLKAAGVEAELADAIVEAMNRSTEKFVTVEHFDAAVERLDTRCDGLEARIDDVKTELLARIDGLEARIDAVRTELLAGIDTVRTEMQASINAVRAEMQASMARSHLISVGIMIAANALMVAVIGFLLTQRAGM